MIMYLNWIGCWHGAVRETLGGPPQCAWGPRLRGRGCGVQSWHGGWREGGVWRGHSGGGKVETGLQTVNVSVSCCPDSWILFGFTGLF